MEEKLNGREKWLKNLKVGDEVYVSEGDYQSPSYIAKVDRLTKTLICLTDKTRYNKKSGRAISQSEWYSTYIYPVTEKREEEIAVRKLKNSVRVYIKILSEKNHLFSTEQLQSLARELRPWAEEALKLADKVEKK